MQFKPNKLRPAKPDTPEEVRQFEKHYDAERLWDKIRKYAKRAGYEVLEKALWLFYAAERPETPVWARATAYGALGYLILPTDAIPDWLLGVGFTDDLGALTLAVGTIIYYIDDDVRAKTKQKLDQWFGDKDQTTVEQTAGAANAQND